jgi:flagellar hook-length control protein FliK
MPFSPLDALMQASASSRSKEPLRNDGPSPFRPALEQAYQAEAPRQAPPAPAPAEAPAKPKESPSAGDQSDSDGPEEAIPSEVSAAPSEDQPQEADDADVKDELEVSAEAAAAAGIVQAAKASEIEDAVMQTDADPQVKESAAAKAPNQTGEQSLESEFENAAPAGEDKGESVPIADGESTSAQQRAKGSTLTGSRDDQSARNSGDEFLANEEGAADGASEAPAADLAVQETADAQPSVELTEGAATGDSSNSEGQSKRSARLAESTLQGDVPKQKSASTEGAISATAASVDANSTPPPPADPAPPAVGGVAKSAGTFDRWMTGRSLKGDDAADTQGAPGVDRARFVQRVEGAMRAAHQRDGKIQVRLSPPDLGSVKIELAVQNGVLSAKLEAETLAARNLLLDSLPALRERLAQQDIRVDKFDVDVRDDRGQSGGGSTDDRTANQSGGREEGRPRANAARPVGPSPLVPSRESSVMSAAASGLDVRV